MTKEKKAKTVEELAGELAAEYPDKFTYIGALIKLKIDESPLNVTKFSKLMFCHRTLVYKYYERKFWYDQDLEKIDKILNYDFVSVYHAYRNKTGSLAKMQRVSVALELDEIAVERVYLHGVSAQERIKMMDEWIKKFLTPIYP